MECFSNATALQSGRVWRFASSDVKVWLVAFTYPETVWLGHMYYNTTVRSAGLRECNTPRCHGARAHERYTRW